VVVVSGDDQFPTTIESARLGDVNALGQLLESCRDYLLGIASRGVGPDLATKAGASDVVQETLLGAF
jgi:DNA-directed RNA polymerase specialized sigma24 family protein